MLTPGQRLAHYEITGHFGSGGMGDVYRARDTNLGRTVALKTLRRDVVADPDRRQRFDREARLLASLSHPNIASVHGFEEVDGLRYLVLEHVDGDTLQARLAAGPLPVADALNIARQIALALEAAHAAGIVHRDLKPANVKITSDETVKVLDFGLAKAMAADADSAANSPTITAGATRAGMLLGTAAYMSPEQARGRTVDQRADLWAFGCVLYEMLTGRQAFGGETISDSLAHVLGRDVDWSLLPDATPQSIRRLLRRCLAREAKLRQQSAADARLDIDDALAGDSAPDDLARGSIRSRGWASARLPWPLAMAGVVLAALAGAIAIPTRTGDSDVASVRFGLALPAGLSLRRNAPPIAVAPDGRSVVVTVEDPNSRGAGPRLARRWLDRLDVDPIAGTELATSPFFLDNGARIGFVDEKSFELKLMDASSGATNVITTLDSFEMRGVTEAPGGTLVMSHRSPGGRYELKRVPIAGGPPTVLAAPDPGKGETEFDLPHMLRDGDHLLYTAEHADGHASVDVLSLSTGVRRTVIDNAVGAQRAASGHLVFFRPTVRATPADFGDFVAVPLDDRTLEVTGDPVLLVPRARHAMFSAGRGTSVFLSASTLMVMHPNTESAPRSLVWVDRSGVTDVLAAAPRMYRQPDLSPDGTRLAFQVDDQDRPLMVHDLTRDVTSRVANAALGDETPRWSPDGLTLAYAGIREGVPHLLVAPADGSGPEQRLWKFDGHFHVNGWQSDGKALYLQVRGGSEDLWTYSFVTRTASEFLASGANEFGGEPSPDGRWLAYVSDESGREEVYVRSVHSSARLQVSRDGGFEPAWTRDGREILFRRPGSSEFSSVPVLPGLEIRLGTPTMLFRQSYFSGGRDRAYVVSPDGKRLLVISPEASSSAEIEVITNWTKNLRRD